MLEQVSTTQTCSACGAALDPSRAHHGGLCEKCSAQPSLSWQQPNEQAGQAPPYDQPYDPAATVQPEAPLDPDNPRWGVGTGIGTWIFSVSLMIIIPVAAVFLMYFIDQARGLPLPNLTVREELLDWVMSPRLLMVQVFYSTITAHLITLGFCWAIVTRFKKQPFLKSLGWNWAGHSVGYWLLISLGVLFIVFAADIIFGKLLPNGETDFDRILKASAQVKYAVVAMAVLSAPFIEEVIYRGVFYGGLRKRLGPVAAVITVTLFFAAVHLPQYWGAWASISGLTLLSLILTIVRAKSKSILPCVTIHLVNNAVGSLLILLSKS